MSNRSWTDTVPEWTRSAFGVWWHCPFSRYGYEPHEVGIRTWADTAVPLRELYSTVEISSSGPVNRGFEKNGISIRFLCHGAVPMWCARFWSSCLHKENRKCEIFVWMRPTFTGLVRPPSIQDELQRTRHWQLSLVVIIDSKSKWRAKRTTGAQGYHIL